MKITKVKTTDGVMGTPVTTSMDAVVERMRSDTTKDAVQSIAREAYSRTLNPKSDSLLGALGATDHLPWLVFSGTFGRGGFDDLRSTTGTPRKGIYIKNGRKSLYR